MKLSFVRKKREAKFFQVKAISKDTRKTETCACDPMPHMPKPDLCKRTTRLRQPMLNPLEQIPIQSLLYKTTSLMKPLFCLPNEKKKLAQNNDYKTLLYLLYCYFKLQSLFNVYKNFKIHKII